MKRRLQLITGIPRALLLSALGLYKRMFSPLFLPACRYVPTCSEYARDAIEQHGAMRGSLMAVWRLLRCNPLAKGGFDPVVMSDSQFLMSGLEGPLSRTSASGTRRPEASQ